MKKLILLALFVLCPVLALASDTVPQLKDGADARCLPGIDSSEFCEENYAGAYTLGPGKCVFIEDARKRKGHLILHADCLGLHCPLYQFNKFIYVYGVSPDSPTPILGTVTFMSDGDGVSQLILQHDGREAYFPMRQ